jgi:hypothetical protein
MSRARSRRWIALAGVLALSALVLGSVAGAEIVQNGGLRGTFEGKLTPQRLPRSGQAPVTAAVSVKVAATKGQVPSMKTMSIALNRYGHVDPSALPVCQLDQIQPATTDDALASCRRSLVGEGRFLANVLVKGQAPFPSDGKIYAFNGEVEGKPAILAHVYGTQPAPASYTIAFLLSKAKGTFGTNLEATLPPVKSGSGYITGIALKLGKAYTHSKKPFITASCPTPKGTNVAPFPFAKAAVAFEDGRSLKTTLVRTCKSKN